MLTNDSGAFIGTATDRDGFYAISRIPQGRYALRASFIGYQPYTDTLDLAADQILTYNFSITFGEANLEEIVVESERETAGGRLRDGRPSINPASGYPAYPLAGSLRRPRNVSRDAARRRGRWRPGGGNSSSEAGSRRKTS